MGETLWQLALAMLLIGVNAFFVATELSLVRIRRTRLEELASSGNRAALRTREMVKRIDEYLSACQIGVTMASLALGWLGEPVFARIIGGGLALIGLEGIAWVHGIEVAIAFLAISYVTIVLGELAPKSIAIRYTQDVALAVSWPMMAFHRATRPFARLLNRSGSTVVRALGLSPADHEGEVHSADELRLLMAESHQSGGLTRDERELLENAFEFSDRTVRQVMRPRGEIAFLSLEDPLEENLERARRTEYTRFPLCRDDVDHVLGLVHVKDLLWPRKPLHSSRDLMELRRDILFVPEMIGVPALLAEMRRRKTQMAVCVDEYGVVSGLCTMEDILEELVGEIQDEFDQELPNIRAALDGFLVEGTVLIQDLNRRLMLHIVDEENDTISGHLLSRLGHVPDVGETLIVDNYRVTVVEVRGLRISRLLFSPVAPPVQPPSHGAVVVAGGGAEAGKGVGSGESGPGGGRDPPGRER